MAVEVGFEGGDAAEGVGAEKGEEGLEVGVVAAVYEWIYEWMLLWLETHRWEKREGVGGLLW